MKILTVLTYYRPHTSGLTIYAERLARAFAKRGHQVTVMTTQYDPSLLLEETLDGVKIVRVPVAARISKGVLAPTFGLVATKLVARHDVVQMHLPQFDAPGVGLRGPEAIRPAWRNPAIVSRLTSLPKIFERSARVTGWKYPIATNNAASCLVRSAVGADGAPDARMTLT